MSVSCFQNERVVGESSKPPMKSTVMPEVSTVMPEVSTVMPEVLMAVFLSIFSSD